MGGLDAAQPLARVGLCLVGESSRAFTGAPARFTIGSVDFGGWQIHPVAAMPQGFPACDAYLVKVNYDISLAADAPEPIWVDAGFEFHDEGVAVADALPRSVRKPTGASRHTLTAHLAFDVADDAATHGAALDSPSTRASRWPRCSQCRIGDTALLPPMCERSLLATLALERRTDPIGR